MLTFFVNKDSEEESDGGTSLSWNGRKGNKENKQIAQAIKTGKKMMRRIHTMPNWRPVLLRLRTTVLRVMMILKEMIQAVTSGTVFCQPE